MNKFTYKALLVHNKLVYTLHNSDYNSKSYYIDIDVNACLHEKIVLRSIKAWVDQKCN